MNLNKKVFFISPFLLAMSSFSMACMQDTEEIRNQVKNAITANGLAKTKVMSMYENCKLRANVKDFDKRNDVELNNTSTHNQDDKIDKAKYWYRGMGKSQYISLDQNRYTAIPCVTEGENDYCGIAPAYTYAKTYPKTEKPKITIEFSTEGLGWLYNEFTTKHDCEYKVEAGTLSYGLGKKGSKCKVPPQYNTGVEFNKWLSTNEIQAQVAYVLLPKNP
ncbi:hypothetical protein GPY51_20065 [Photorhabdus laumondii subsp. laumondii]|uniref:Photorhabdus luminescens subsp. laumondii TTO1 complete genome segment 11/17 n=2 Tax=Photorhabdus laumondii subsp. laumondii TaxID=141679 RepID=Q7N2H9_PHOLL|nr:MULTISPECIES: hypothetical protein [Photorhabdus]AXG48115.1 hypothetical protein PluTT01m_15945 [Photorhabdus laumondii subsp. laumondii]KTL62636.1 hypothetical protein AA106_05675 [Photorhabdus laumondii subsp. laumondii]MCC8386228.1 hypothetical protein [Photorhabdus laumondii]MCC8415226.1 hypothetical protein [Photorhabdus laumondii]NDK96588.1 hypothetical protein [Photorhabdus laumondii subsp. laumondii]